MSKIEKQVLLRDLIVMQSVEGSRGAMLRLNEKFLASLPARREDVTVIIDFRGVNSVSTDFIHGVFDLLEGFHVRWAHTRKNVEYVINLVAEQLLIDDKADITERS